MTSQPRKTSPSWPLRHELSPLVISVSFRRRLLCGALWAQRVTFSRRRGKESTEELFTPPNSLLMALGVSFVKLSTKSSMAAGLAIKASAENGNWLLIKEGGDPAIRSHLRSESGFENLLSSGRRRVPLALGECEILYVTRMARVPSPRGPLTIHLPADGGLSRNDALPTISSLRAALQELTGPSQISTKAFR